jgi:hypothetical protein
MDKEADKVLPNDSSRPVRGHPRSHAIVRKRRNELLGELRELAGRVTRFSLRGPCRGIVNYSHTVHTYFVMFSLLADPVLFVPPYPMITS